MHTVAQHCAEYVASQGSNCAQFVWLVPQKAGTAVRVPSGYLHWVCNSRECFKVATEILCAEDVPRVITMQQQLRMYMEHNQSDYMPPVHKVVDALLKIE